jgi:ribonuclease I
MTFELAVQTLWRAIDQVFYAQWPKGAKDRVQLRISKKLGKLEELHALLSVCGTWAVRASDRREVVVAHVVGVLNRRNTAPGVLAFLAENGWTVTDLALGV